MLNKTAPGTPQAPPNAPAAARKPVHTIRLGAIKAAIWENAVGEGVRHGVSFCRLYKDGDQWKTTESFGRDDLLLLAKVADQVHTWICEQPRPA
jgi:hypothetical protein